MTDTTAPNDTSALIRKGDAIEPTLGRTRDLLGLTARLLGRRPAAPPPVPTPKAQQEGGVTMFAGPHGLSFQEPVTGMEFVWVPGGSFQMGDVLGDATSAHELPVHTVTLPGFYLGRYAVTQGEWARIMGNFPGKMQRGERYPAALVSWNDAQDFLTRLNRESGHTFTLPSEAQWEYAAREGGRPIRFGTGRDSICTDEAHFDCSPRHMTVPVDSFAPNALGLYQMSGNVYEWCQDQWHDTYEGAPCDGSAWETEENDTNRVARGGSWCFSGKRGSSLRAAHRTLGGPDDRDENLGLRLALSIHPPEEAIGLNFAGDATGGNRDLTRKGKEEL